MYGRYCKRARRHGLTIVEVLVGILLLSTLLVTMLVAFSRHRRQMERASLRLEAIEIADELLASWYARVGGVPYEEAGRCGPQNEFTWRTHLVPSSQANSIQMDVIRLEIKESAAVQEPSLAAVELALPKR